MEEVVRKLEPDDLVSLTAKEMLKYIDGYNRYEYMKKLNPITFGELYRLKISEQVDLDLVIDYYRSRM